MILCWRVQGNAISWVNWPSGLLSTFRKTYKNKWTEIHIVGQWSLNWLHGPLLVSGASFSLYGKYIVYKDVKTWLKKSPGWNKMFLPLSSPDEHNQLSVIAGRIALQVLYIVTIRNESAFLLFCHLLKYASVEVYSEIRVIGDLCRTVNQVNFLKVKKKKTNKQPMHLWSAVIRHNLRGILCSQNWSYCSRLFIYSCEAQHDIYRSI